MTGEGRRQTAFPLMNSGTVEAHLRDVHGLSLVSDDGPCGDGLVTKHNLLHWPQSQPTHSHHDYVTTAASDTCTCGEFDCEACIENGTTDDATSPTDGAR